MRPTSASFCSLQPRCFAPRRPICRGGISVFLRIFEAVFAIETIVFGLAYLADELGLWPKAYADYALAEFACR